MISLWAACNAWTQTTSAAEPSFFFLKSDLKKPGELILQIRAAGDPLCRYLKGHFSPQTRRAIDKYNGKAPPNDAVLGGLVRDLNRLLPTESFYEPERFKHIILTEETKTLIEDKRKDEKERIRLNRMLLEQAFPENICELILSPIEIRADSLELDTVKNVLIGSGHVVIRRTNEFIKCDHIVMNLESFDVISEGNVVFESDNDTWTGEKMTYNFRTRQGRYGEYFAFFDPFYIHAEESQQISPTEILLNNATVTTCEGDSPSAYIRAQRVRLIPGRHIYAFNVVVFVKGIPVMYTPYWAQNIGDPNFISFVPGYSSRMGAFLLMTFNNRLSKKVESATHLGYRTKRGPSMGQDLMWSASGNAKGLSIERYFSDDESSWYFGNKSAWDRQIEDEDAWFGDLITYYIKDDWPDEGEDQDYTIPEDRYRLQLYHSQTFDEKNYMLTQLSYLSDPEFIEQYFRDEYRTNPEPDNYFVLTHHGNYFSANLMIQKRFNDFYTSVDRLPELSLDFSRQQIFSSPFYYEGQSAASYLSKLWEKNRTNKVDYSAFRFDTEHAIYYPIKLFDFLNITPRVGYRGTYYSKTKEDITNVVVTTTTDTNDVITYIFTTNVVARDMDAELRSRPQIGLETSFKAFKVWETYPGHIINDIRHIAEPYANYTYIFDQNILPSRLYQFDKVDELEPQNDIRIGMRNKLQTKRGQVYDLINADIWTFYRLDPEQDQNDFDNLYWDILSSPFDWLKIRFEGDYDFYDQEINVFNPRFTVRPRRFFSIEMEYRYESDGPSSLLSTTLSITPFINWQYDFYERYDFESSILEAYGFAVKKVIDCISVQVGFEQDANYDYTLWVEMWFTEFPKIRLGAGL